MLQDTLFPYEMLTGVGRQHVLLTCLQLIGDMIEDGSYVTIVSNDTHRSLLNLGLALDPGEYIVVETGT